MRRACVLVLGSLSCYLLILLLFILWRVHQPGELVPVHLNPAASTEESRKDQRKEAAGGDGSLQLTQQQEFIASLLPLSSGTTLKLSSPKRPIPSLLLQQESPEHRQIEPLQNEQQDPGQFHTVARLGSTVGDAVLVRHEDSEPKLSIHIDTNSDVASHYVTTLPLNQMSPHSVTRHQTEVHAPSAVQETGRFVIHPGFRFPHPRAVRSVNEIMQSDWLKELKAALHTMSTTPVTMVTSNLQYRDVLLNWLISAVVKAGIPLRSILVIAMDKPLHFLLRERSLNSILVTPEALLSQATLAMGTFNQVMMTRLAILRLLNHWGLDVAFYDTDAIMLKDPQPVFNRHRDSEIVGVVGKFPAALYREWRVALCTAVMLVRSSTSTEFFWEATSREQPGSFSDQERMNYGLRALHIKWLGGGGEGKEARGMCKNNMSVILLPYSFTCRSNCKRSERGSYYVWHKGGPRDRESKMKNAELGGMWFLRSDWNSACKGRGVEWLKCIAMQKNNLEN